MIIQTRNNLADQSQYTFTAFPEVSGTNLLRVGNTNGLNNGWAVQLGSTGQEYAEIVNGTAASGSTITCENTRFPHPTDTPIFFIKWDQLVFERSITGTTGVAAPMTNGTVDITPDSINTNFDDTGGTTTYAYKTYFKSTGLGVISTESDWITPQGFDYYSLAKMRQRIRSKLWNSSYIQDSEINDWINEWKETMVNVAIGVNEDYLVGTTSITYTGTQSLGTISVSDFKQLKRVEYTEDNGITSTKARKMYLDEFYPQEVFAAYNPYFYMQGDNIIGRKPSDSTGVFNIWYYKLDAPLVNDTDILPLSLRGYTKSFVDYCQAQAYSKDENKLDIYDRKMQEVNKGLDTFKTQIAPRNKTGASQISYVEVVSGEDNTW